MWDVACMDTFVTSFLAGAASEAGAVAAMVEENKKAKYQHFDTLHMFVSFAVETTSVFGPLACAFLEDTGRRVFSAMVVRSSHTHITHCVSAATQRSNVASVMETSGQF